MKKNVPRNNLGFACCVYLFNLKQVAKPLNVFFVLFVMRTFRHCCFDVCQAVILKGRPCRIGLL